MRPRLTFVALWFVALLIIQGQALTLRRNGPTTNLLERVKTTTDTTNDEECLTSSQVEEVLEEQIESGAVEEVVEAIQAIAAEDVVEAVTEAAEAQEEVNTEEVTEAIEDVVSTDEIAEAVEDSTGEELTTEQIIEAVEAYTGAETVEEAVEAIADLDPEEIIEAVTEVAEEQHEEQQEIAEAVEEVVPTDELADAVSEETGENLTPEEIIEVVQEATQAETPEEVAEAIENLSTEELVDLVSEQVEADVEEQAEEQEQVEEAIEEVVDTQEVAEAVAEETGVDVTTADIVEAVQESTGAETVEEALEYIADLSPAEIVDVVSEAAEREEEHECLTRQEVAEVLQEQIESEEVADVIDAVRDIATTEVVGAFEEAVVEERNEEIIAEEATQAAEDLAAEAGVSEEEINEVVEATTGGAGIEDVIQAAETIATQEVVEAVAAAVREQAESGECLTQAQIVEAAEQAIEAGLEDEVIENIENASTEDVLEAVAEAAVEAAAEEELTEAVRDAGVAEAVAEETGEHLSTQEIIEIVQETTGVETAEEAAEIVADMSEDELIETVVEATEQAEAHEELGIAIEEVISTSEVADTVAEETGQQLTSEEIIQAVQEATGAATPEEAEEIAATLEPEDIIEIATEAAIEDRAEERAEREEIAGAIDEVVATEDVADAVQDATGEDVSTADIITAVQEATGAETVEEAVEIIENLDENEIIEIVSEAAIEDREEEEIAVRETIEEVISTEDVVNYVSESTGRDISTEDVIQAVTESGVTSEEIADMEPEDILEIIDNSYGVEEPTTEEPTGEESEEEPQAESDESESEEESTAPVEEAEHEPTCSTRSANFTYEICGAHVKFNATDLSPSIVSYEWDFGECSCGADNVATGTHVSHEYGGPGSYEVTLTITDDTGKTSKRKHIICLGPHPDVRPPPVSNFNCLIVGDTVTCTSSSNGTIAGYAWDFGEGDGVEENTGTTVTHTYTSAGQFNITLTVTDDRGLTGTYTHTITPTVADFQVNITGNTVECTSQSSGSVTSYVWNFGDSESGSENVASGNSASHTYTSPASYTITLTITDEAGNTVTRSHEVTPTVADFSIEVAGDSVTVTAHTSGSVASYAWNFGEVGSDSNEGTGNTATHTYIRAGTFTILLTITDEHGNTAEASHAVTPTVAGFSFQIFGDTVDFDAARSSGEITAFQWNFGEGQGTATGLSVSHKFNAIGTFTVSLTVTDSEGHSATTSQTVETTVILGTGSLQFTVVWDRRGDGDLHVKTPKQKVIYYGNQGPAAATDYGQLDVDDRTGTGPENIFWATNATPPAGTYHVCFSTYSFDPEPSEAAPVVGTVSIRRPDGAPIILVKSLTVTDRNHDCTPASGSYVGSYTYGEGEVALAADFECQVNGESVSCDAISSTGNIHGYSWSFGEEGSESNEVQGERASHTYSTAGAYTVTLTIRGENGETSVKTHSVTPTIAGFTTEITGNTVTVTTTSSGTITNFFWDFGEQSSGEENTGSGNTISHTYTTAGTFTITLTVTDENGATSTRTQTITPTVADFEYSVSGDTVSGNSTSSGAISTVSWDFGDANSADNVQTGNQATHTYTHPGTYDVNLAVTDNAGHTVGRGYEVTPTIAGYTFTVAGDTVTFDGTSSSGVITSFEWNFGDEGSEDNEGTGSSVSHTYTTAGTYTVTLTITDENGVTSTETTEVTPTIASFTFAVSGDTVTGNAEGSSGTITGYSWNFGDEGSETNTASGSTASHTYTTAGSYTVTLTITDESGTTNVYTQTVTPTVSDFGFEIRGNTVIVSSRSSGSIVSHFWDFGDSSSGVNNVASGSSANHTYNTAGTFTVTLTVTDQDNATNTRTHSVTPTVAEFSYEINGNTVNFNAGGSSGTIASYAWNFGEEASGESNTATTATASHTYTRAGDVTVRLTVTDEAGNTVTREQTLTPTVASFTLTLFGDTIDVDASASSGAISSYAWNFGEDSGEESNTATGSTASHKFAATGSYTVTLTVTDEAGNTATSSQTASPEVILGLGNLQFTLIWDRPGDADLVVKTPKQKVIYYGNAGSNAGTDYGKLDVDDRSGTGPENIFWPSEYQPPRGTYHVCFLTYSFNPAPTEATPVVATVSIRRPTGRAIRIQKTLTVTNRDTNCSPSSSNYVGSYTYGEGTVALAAQFTCAVSGSTIRCDAFNSEGNINGYSWDFGDEQSGTSNTASGETASHTYTAAGSYTVSLTVRDDTGATNTKTLQVVPTISDFGFEIQGNQVTVTSRSSGTISSHYWDFGDSASALGNVASGSSASHIYRAPGTYTITLTVTDEAGQTSIRRYTVTPTVAQISATLNGNTIIFSGAGSSGAIASYAWDFGDSAAGEGNSATGSQVSHTYTTPGSFNVTLTLTDQGGATVSFAQTVTPTVAEFNFATHGSEVKVESLSSGNIASYAWDFGETGRGASNTASGASARHTYTTAGTFTVTLTVTDNFGFAVNRTRTVTPTVAAFTVTTRGNTVSVQSTGSGTVTAYNWNFGDQSAADNVATGQTASHTYNTPGTFTITLGVTDATGVITTTRTVTPTVAEFTVEVTGETVNVRATGSGTIASYEWNFGETGSSGNTATGQAASHRYTNADQFTITLKVTDSTGGSSTRTRTVTPTVAALTCQNNGASISCNAAGSSGSITSYSWNFGDSASGTNNVATGNTAAHTYSAVGTYTVTLTVTDSNRGTSSKTQTVTPTVADFSVTVVGDTVNVDARSSGGQITRYAWNFGEAASGANNVATGATSSHRYTTGGSFTVTLTITDSTGSTSTKTKTVSPTVAVLSCQLFGDTVDCTALGTSGTISSYAWNFGEATSTTNTASGLTASHKYASRGTFTITLKVTDAAGSTSTQTTTVTPTVSLGAGNLQFTLIWDRRGDGDLLVATPNGKIVYYANAGSNTNTDFAKLDVDDRTGTGPENIFWPTEYLPPDGTYHVCFNTYNFSPEPSAGNPVEGTISIRRPDGAPITLRKRMTQTVRDAACSPSTSNYVGSYNYVATNRVPLVANLVCTLFGDTVDCDAATSTGTISTYAWTFGDTASSTNTVTGRTASHKYTARAVYTITLTVTSNTGVTSTKTTTVEPTAFLGSGNLQFTLIWDRRGDADLVVRTPGGKIVYFGNSQPSANTEYGKLDVDDTTGTGPENIFWPDQYTPPTGTYHVCFLTYNFNPAPSPSTPVTATASIRRPTGTPITIRKTLTETNRDTNCTPASSNYLGSYTYTR